MKSFDGVIFDVDGTLTSTNELIFAAFNFIAKKYLDKTFTNEQIMKLFGPPEDVILRELCGDNFESAQKDYYEFYSDNHQLASIYPGIIELLENLKSKNIFLSVYTGKGRKAALITLDKLNISGYFDMIVTGDDVENHKPHPEGILVFLNKFNLKKERVLMIGDAPSDIKAAKSAGVKVASVLWDPYVKKELNLTLDSDYIFHDVDELKLFLRRHID